MDGSKIGNLMDNKDIIMGFLSRGPNIPVRIANHLQLDTLITSAFLSELLSDRKLKLSKLKVGNSPVYFIPGQELRLEEFTQFLNSKEKEAFDLLKEKGVLLDTMQNPAIRVALRSLKDFSFPFEFDGRLFWRYLSLSEDEGIELVKKRSVKPKVIKEKPKTFEKIKRVFVPIPKIEKEVEEEIIEKPKKINLKEKSEFVLNVEKFLKSKDILINQEIGYKKKEYAAKVSIKSQLGNVEYLCLAKDRKSITENDLKLALQEVQSTNLPVLIITPGIMSKKALERYKDLKNIIFFKQM